MDGAPAAALEGAAATAPLLLVALVLVPGEGRALVGVELGGARLALAGVGVAPMLPCTCWCCRCWCWGT